MSKTITVKLPDELHKIFKIKMVLENETMQDRIIKLIDNEVKRLDEKIKTKTYL